MKRLAVPVCIAAALAMAAILFHVKQEVRELERELRLVNGAILGHREAIQVLRSEWSYLNQPDRIAELAKRHLDMRPFAPDQVIRLADIPFRAPPADAVAAPGTGAPVGPAQLTAVPPMKGTTHKTGTLQ